ncbi:coiled-coil domain-containing protein 78 isoform X1 [Oryctolagus cuniculus]|uniref:coiled-coil domain-containing protein 78 isoform X1 n=1 Tax=Oryctolagus cuniculus TaxID=9986 RepID=UPI00387A372A
MESSSTTVPPPGVPPRATDTVSAPRAPTYWVGAWLLKPRSRHPPGGWVAVPPRWPQELRAGRQESLGAPPPGRPPSSSARSSGCRSPRTWSAWRSGSSAFRSSTRLRSSSCGARWAAPDPTRASQRARRGQRVAACGSVAACPQVLRLESRVLQLEPHGDGAGPEQPQRPGPSGRRGLQLLGGPEQLQGAVGQVLEHHRARQQALESRVAALGQQLQEAREEARAAGQQLATQAAVSPAPRATTGWRGSEGGVRGPPPPQALQQAQAETARLQLQLKQRTEEHAAQLQRCARQAVAGPEPAAVALRPFLEATLQDIRAAHRSREQQLARAARTFQRRLADLSRRHEELLATHSSGVCPYGHWPGGVAPMARRRHVAAHVEAGRSPVSSWPARQAFQTTTPSRRGTDAASWAQTCQKLWDFSRGTQAELEQERAQLLGRAAVAEQQLSRLQEYVEQHLGRYKQEILRLRKLVGVGAPREVRAALAAELQGPGARSRWPAWPAQSLPHGLPSREPPR